MVEEKYEWASARPPPPLPEEDRVKSEHGIIESRWIEYLPQSTTKLIEEESTFIYSTGMTEYHSWEDMSLKCVTLQFSIL